MQKGVLPDEGISIEAGEEAVEGHWQQADVLVGDQAEEEASQAGICNPRGSVCSGELLHVPWGQEGDGPAALGVHHILLLFKFVLTKMGFICFARR